MRWRQVLLAVAVFLVTLEFALQIGALAMALFGPHQERTTQGTVLCVGDSFTFGVGASSPATSYPSQLTAALAARGLPGVAVSNAGFPGQDSADVLRRLPSQLTPATRVLCVLVGANDSWRHPAKVDLAELTRAPATEPSARGFAWRWRTARLFQLLTRFEANSWQPAEQPKATPPAASTANGTAADDVTAGFAELAKWGLPTGTARLGRYEPDRTLPTARNDEFRRRMESGDFAQACACAEQSAHDHPDSPLALQQVVTGAARTGQRDKAMAAVERLAQLHATKPTAAAAECLAEAYLTTGQPDAAIAVAKQRLAEQPLSIMAWDCLQRAAFVLGRRADALQSMPETIRLLGRSEPAHTAFIARNFARWWLDDDPDKAVGLLVSAHLLDNNAEETRIALAVAAPVLARPKFESAMAALGAPERPAAQQFAAILDEVYAGKGAELWSEVLRDHLVAMHELARRGGVDMVIVGYPFPQPVAERAQREAARTLGVPFVPIRERFEQERRARGELFAPDGHCNDAGYTLLAETVAAAVASRLAR